MENGQEHGTVVWIICKPKKEEMNGHLWKDSSCNLTSIHDIYSSTTIFV